MQQLAGVGSMVPQYESPVRILGKEAVTGKQQSVERDDLGQELQALGAVLPRRQTSTQISAVAVFNWSRQALIR